MTEPSLRVAGLYLYPVKSCGPVVVDELPVGPSGPARDRRWMLVSGEGVALTQRDHPRLTLVRVSLDGETTVLRADGLEPLRLPPSVGDGAQRSTELWGEPAAGVDAGDGPAAWLSQFLDRPVRLLFCPPRLERPVDSELAREGDRVGFADGYPLLVANRASLDDLNRRLAEPVEMLRFRPNVVVAGTDAWAEDGWRRLRGAEVELELVKACPRCSVTTVDLATGRFGQEPLRTLATFRRGRGGVLFGQNAIPRRTGTLRLGESLGVDSR